VETDEDGKLTDDSGWPIGSRFRYPQHKTLEDRIRMANKFIQDYEWNIPLYLDNMDNEFNEKYAAWPDSAYLIFENKLVYEPHDTTGKRDTAWTNYIEDILLD
jgi:hypothetical protein